MDIDKHSDIDFITKHCANKKFCSLSFLISFSILGYIFNYLKQGKKYQEDDIYCLILVSLILSTVTSIIWDILFLIFQTLLPINFTSKNKGNFPFPEKLYTNPIVYFMIIYFSQKTFLKNTIDILFFFFFLNQFSIIKFYFTKVTNDFSETINSQTVINNDNYTSIYKKFKRGLGGLFIFNLCLCCLIYIIIKYFSLFDIFSFLGLGLYNTIKIIEVFITNRMYFFYLSQNINTKEKTLIRNLKIKFILQMISCNFVLLTLIVLFLKSNMKYYHLRILLIGLSIFQLLCIIYLFQNYENTKKYYYSIEKGFPLINKSNEECIICTDKLENARMLKCNHYFHLVCLTQWIEAGNYNCPLCRKEIQIDIGLLRFFQNFEENGFFQIIRGCIPNIL